MATHMPDFDAPTLLSLAAALGLGLLVGVVRERRLPEVAVIAGVRTHALVALAGAVALRLGVAAFVSTLLLVGLMAAMSYRRSREDDPGLTGEVALVLTVLLGGLAVASPTLASALGVVVAVLLYAKAPLHRLSRDLISEKELRDGLLLLASALVVLPLIPDRTIGPFDVFNPRTLWMLVVLIMSISALGHVALRATGDRWGLAIAGFFAGFVSSTAATGGFGQRAREHPEQLSSAVGATILASFSSLLLNFPVLLAVAPALVGPLVPVLGASGLVLLVGGVLGIHRHEGADAPAPTAESRMFSFRAALVLAALIAGVLFIAAALGAWLGPRGAIVAAIVASAADIHAATATLGNLFATGVVDADVARWAMVGMIAASGLVKSIFAFTAGGWKFGSRVGIGHAAMVAAAVAAVMLFPGAAPPAFR